MSAPVTLPLRVRVGGPTPANDAPPVVLVHGYGVSSSYLVPLAHALAPSHRVYVPDLPGHGRSPHAPAPLDVPALADALLAALTALDVQRAVLVGNSLGCAIAVEAAVRAPARVAGLVLVGPTGDPTARSRTRLVLRAARAAPFERMRLLLTVARDYLRAGPRLVWREMTHMLAHRLAPLLPQVRAPAVVVRGEHDLIAPPRWAAEVAARLPRGRCVTIAGAAHAAHWSHPQAVAAVVDEVVDAAADAAVHDAVDGGTAHAAGGAPPPAADADAADPRPPLA